MTVAFLAASVYQNSNWYTALVDKNRQIVLTISIDGIVAGTHYQDVRVGQPIQMQKNDSSVDLGYSGILFDHLPTTFSSLSVDVSINKTSEDGLQNLIGTLSGLSSQIPALSVSQSAFGVVSGVKSITDYLFAKQLLEQKVKSHFPFTSGAGIAPGVYVILAGDTEDDYAKYQNTDADGPGLPRSNGRLLYNGGRVSKVSYFVIEVGYRKKFFADALSSLSYTPQKPWAALFVHARSDVNSIIDPNDNATVNKIRTELLDGDALLDADPDYIQNEKDSIADTVLADTTKLVSDRISALQTSGFPGQSPHHHIGDSSDKG